MQQEAGLRLKGLVGRLAWEQLPISLVYRATMELLARRLYASPGERFPGEAATSAGGSRVAPSPSGPIEAPFTRAGRRIVHQHFTNPVAFNNNASPCNTIDFTGHY